MVKFGEGWRELGKQRLRKVQGVETPLYQDLPWSVQIPLELRLAGS